MPDNTETKLADLDDTIESGITSSSADGQSGAQDLAHLQRVRRDLRLQDPVSIAAGKARPPIVGLRLGGAW